LVYDQKISEKKQYLPVMALKMVALDLDHSYAAAFYGKH